ncbi:hypothetical protein [Niveispirillum fermenti]|uniref:hypothetical protein n=1 Tax=Niveispirillum fermenti TaxID=1233113 RepID=UPI003A8B1E8C
MIICPEFIFLHLHKSGGTFANQLLLKCVPGARRAGYHLPYAELPVSYRHLPVAGTVRNPWDYYVSWYFFQRQQERPNALFLTCSDNGALDFAGTIRNLVTLHEDPARIRVLEAAFPTEFMQHGLNLTSRCIAGIRGTGLGFYSFLYRRLYAGAAAPRIIPTEHLRSGLRALLAGLAVPAEPLATLFLEQAPPMNTSRHGPFRDYYSPALRDLVGLHEQAVILAHDYRF